MLRTAIIYLIQCWADATSFDSKVSVWLWSVSPSLPPPPLPSPFYKQSICVKWGEMADNILVTDSHLIREIMQNIR